MAFLMCDGDRVTYRVAHSYAVHVSEVLKKDVFTLTR